jgi:hypothetical protein
MRRRSPGQRNPDLKAKSRYGKIHRHSAGIIAIEHHQSQSGAATGDRPGNPGARSTNLAGGRYGTDA